MTKPKREVDTPFGEMLEAWDDFPHLPFDMYLQETGQIELSQQINRLALHLKMARESKGNN